MKITHNVKDTDRIEIPIYVNGSFAERILLTGKELNRLVVLLQDPVEPTTSKIVVPDTGEVKLDGGEDSTRTQIDGTDGKNLIVDSGSANKNDVVLPAPAAGEDVREVRKTPEQTIGDDAAEKRGD